MNKYKITKNNLLIIDSHNTGKKYFAGILASVKALHPNSDVWKRSMKSLKREWAVHNFFSRTKDCALSQPNHWAWLYYIVGALVWPLIR